MKLLDSTSIFLFFFSTVSLAADCFGGKPKANAPYRNRAAELCRNCGPPGACVIGTTSGGGVVCSLNVPRNKQTLYCEEAMGDIIGQCIGGGQSGGKWSYGGESYECHAN
ncbi:hypothetical protein LX32DRAFT_640464 [Colletotrichum zoysiae]|uniref:Uncharacterized protein n=1 Tax=Colletotrichum zoysiae TaxID=1216348 RepID=A0AAD9LZ58_9PEZI|nr:hypothetical protein LX32DRAFT_640464 [Colletotrichum zoysiae]